MQAVLAVPGVDVSAITVESAHADRDFNYEVHLAGQKVGGVSLTKQDRYPDTLWVAGATSMPNQGVMSAAGPLILRALMRDPAVVEAGITKVFTYIAQDNYPSLGVIAKLGFVEIDPWPDRPTMRRWLLSLPG